MCTESADRKGVGLRDDIITLTRTPSQQGHLGWPLRYPCHRGSTVQLLVDLSNALNFLLRNGEWGQTAFSWKRY